MINVEITDQDRLKILTQILTLWATASEKRDVTNIISDATMTLRHAGDARMSPERTKAFFEDLEKKIRESIPNFKWPDPDYEPRW